jgi:hypothetical protein
MNTGRTDSQILLDQLFGPRSRSPPLLATSKAIVVLLMVFAAMSACGAHVEVDAPACVGTGGATADAGHLGKDASADATCVASESPTACGCCFDAQGNINCPPDVVPPDAAVLTLPLCVRDAS